ncbi:MAG: hypothetical protein AAF677_10615 [Pseudomonadota bacterium]
MTGSETVPAPPGRDGGLGLAPEDRAEQAAEALAPHLKPGERLVWAGRPMMRPLLEGHEIILPVLSILLVGAINRVVSTIGIDAGLEGRLMGALMFAIMAGFLAIAAYFPVRSILRRRRSHYGVTEERAIILETGPGGELRSFALDWDQIVNVREGARVSIIFELSPEAPYVRETGFQQLHDGMAVFRLIRLIQAARTPAA